MAQGNSLPPRWLRVSFALAILLLLVINVGTIVVRHNNAKPVSIHDAIARYRAETHHTPTPTPTGPVTTIPPSRHTSVATPATVPTSGAPTATATATAVPSTTASQPVRSGNPSVQPSPSATPTPSTTTTTSSTIELPPRGVYSYATTGGEDVSVPGGSRTFPKTTTVTVESSGCGVSERWDPSTKHSETRELCLDDHKVRLASFGTTVSFFGIGSTETYTCGQDAFVYSPGQKLGAGRAFTCTSDDSTADLMVTPDGYRRFQIDGTSVRTLKIAVSADLSGTSKGHSTQHLWFTTDDSVLVRITSKVKTTQRHVVYQEHYTMMLDHLEAQQ